MKKLLLILSFVSLVVTGLSGCYIAPYGDHEGGYQRDRDHRDQRRDRDDHDDRGGERGHDGYH